MQPGLNEAREVARLVDLVVQRDGADDIGKISHRLLRAGVLTSGNRLGLRIGREVQEVGLDTACAHVVAGVGVNRQKEVSAGLIRDLRSLLERDERARAARQNHLDAGLRSQQLLQLERDIQHELGFGEALRPGARIVPAMAGVDDDAPHAEPELP